MVVLNFLNLLSLDKGNYDCDVVRIFDFDFDGFLWFCFIVFFLIFSFDWEDCVWLYF